MRERETDGERGQAHTLEAVTAALVLLSGIVFALQATAVTPLTGSTSNQYIENQQGDVAEGLLAAEAENGTVKNAVLYYNDSSSANTFYNASVAGYTSGGPPLPFGEALNETFIERGVAVNVNVYFVRDGGDRLPPRSMVHFGQPSSNAAIASHTVTLYDDDRLLAPDGTPTTKTVKNSNYFVDHDIAPGNRLYNVLRVEVIVWRM